MTATTANPAEETAKRPRHVPAYCDPNNEARGSKYEAGLSTVEIAKRLRAEIKAAIKDGKLPKMTVSVRVPHYNDLQIRISDLPLNPYTRLYAAARNASLDLYNTPWRDQVHTAEALAIRDRLEEMAQAYRRDNSDISSDYFDCNFYLSVNFDWKWDADQLKALQAEEAANPTIEVFGEYGRVNGYHDLLETEA